MSDRYLLKAKGQTSGKWHEGLITRLDKDVCHIKSNPHDKWICDPYSICRYTGFTYKNDEGIWENDIVKHRENIGIVNFGKHGVNYGFHVQWVKGDSSLRDDFLYWHKKVEHIGNIFDNPEILKGE